MGLIETGNPLASEHIKHIAGLYPFVENSHGIPFERILASRPSRLYHEITGGSGRPLEFLKLPGYLGIKDVNDEQYILEMGLTGKNIRFNLHSRTINSDGSLSEPHPDFFAGKFITLCLNQFPKVETINATWLEGSINHTQYQTDIKNGLSRKDAVKNTWTAQLFMQNGFKPDESEIINTIPTLTNSIYTLRFRKNI